MVLIILTGGLTKFIFSNPYKQIKYSGDKRGDVYGFWFIVSGSFSRVGLYSSEATAWKNYETINQKP
jgi:hypothetical protein